MNLDQQRVIVFGGSSGIGLGVARASLDAGASVTIVGRSPERLTAAVSRLASPRVDALAADLTDEAQVARCFQERPAVHHVVVTAVHPYYRPVREFDPAQARLALDTKLTAALLVAKHARFAEGGSLTLTTGIAAERPGANGSVIAALNGALEALARALALELSPVRVNALSPGWVETPVWETLAGERAPAILAQQASKLPVRRVGQPEDLGRAALFLMTSGFTTGETLHVDGGHRLV